VRPSAVALVGASASWCSRGLWAVVCHVVRRFMFCIYVLGGGWDVRAGYVFFGCVRRFYIIIIGLFGRLFVCFFECRGCRRLSEPSVVDGIFRVDVRFVCSGRTCGCVGFVIR
jgi:hypothetical protein